MDYAPSSHQSHEQSDGKSGEKSKKKSTIYDSNFEQILVDTGSLASWNSLVPVPKPRNWDDLREILAQDPAECTQLEYEDFVHKSLAARGETKMITSLFPMILGNDDIPYEQDKVFTNLAPFTDGIADARPDLFDGSFPTDVGIDVRRRLSQLIVPSKQSGIPILPNFFLEAKGPEGTTVVAKRQVLYDGTLGARGIHSIQCYGREPFFDNNAYTFSATLHDGVLRIYTTHPACPQGSTVYYTVQIQAYLLDEDLDSFQRGLTALRNARRFSKSQREKLIHIANERSRSSSSSGSQFRRAGGSTDSEGPQSG